MKVLQNFQKLRVLWHGRAELSEVPGIGMNALHNITYEVPGTDNTRVDAHPHEGSSI